MTIPIDCNVNLDILKAKYMTTQKARQAIPFNKSGGISPPVCQRQNSMMAPVAKEGREAE